MRTIYIYFKQTVLKCFTTGLTFVKITADWKKLSKLFFIKKPLTAYNYQNKFDYLKNVLSVKLSWLMVNFLDVRFLYQKLLCHQMK